MPTIQLKGRFKSLVTISQYYDFLASKECFSTSTADNSLQFLGKEFSGAINKFNVSEFCCIIDIAFYDHYSKIILHILISFVGLYCKIY